MSKLKLKKFTADGVMFADEPVYLASEADAHIEQLEDSAKVLVSALEAAAFKIEYTVEGMGQYIQITPQIRTLKDSAKALREAIKAYEEAK